MVSVAIMAHPKRLHMAVELQGRIGGDIVVDPDPNGIRSPWRTNRHALSMTPAGMTHRLVVQDDVDVCVNFVEAVERIADVKTDGPVALCITPQHRGGTQALFRACEHGECFALIPESVVWIPAIALLWPADLIGDVLAWTEEQKQFWPPGFTADDEILGRACRALGYPVWMTVPSLVEHPDDVEPVIRRKRVQTHHPNLHRMASCFIDGDPLDIEWA